MLTMTSLRQIEANRRNARFSTGPVTAEGKKQSRKNAVRHGLTAETVIDALEDAGDYATFELAITADYDAQTEVERELVLRLASLLWRLRRATAIESGLFKLQAEQLLQFRSRRAHQSRWEAIHCGVLNTLAGTGEPSDPNEPRDPPAAPAGLKDDDLTPAYLGSSDLSTAPLDRHSRYEATLWRQACQVLFSLQFLQRRRPWRRMRP